MELLKYTSIITWIHAIEIKADCNLAKINPILALKGQATKWRVSQRNTRIQKIKHFYSNPGTWCKVVSVFTSRHKMSGHYWPKPKPPDIVPCFFASTNAQDDFWFRKFHIALWQLWVRFFKVSNFLKMNLNFQPSWNHQNNWTFLPSLHLYWDRAPQKLSPCYNIRDHMCVFCFLPVGPPQKIPTWSLTASFAPEKWWGLEDVCLSYWVSVTFQGQTVVKLRGIYPTNTHVI